MLYHKNNKIQVIILLVVCLLTLGSALAILSSSLVINGTNVITNASWDIRFASVTKTAGSPNTGDGTINITNGTNIQISDLSFLEPQTYVEYTAVIENVGDFNAYLSYFNTGDGVTCTGGTAEENNNVCKYLTVSLTSGDEAFPRMTASNSYNEPLGSGQSKSIKIRVDYDKNREALPSEIVGRDIFFAGLNINLLYSQG